MKHFWPFALILASLSLSALACESGTVLSTAAPGALFQDDFSQPSGGWTLSQDEMGVTEYADGGLRITINTETADFFTVPGLSFTDVRIEVDTLKVGGPDNNDFGVICRYRDVNNFYFLKITSDGYYVIGKLKGDSMSLIGMADYTPSSAIKTGPQVNHLRADCVGTTLRLYANGVLLAETQDADFGSGDVGLIAGTFAQPGVAVLFDNFSVARP